MENTQSSRSGRTFPAPCPVTKETTSASSSKSSPASATRPYQFLDLRSGETPDSWSDRTGPYLGESWTPNTTEQPNVAVECLPSSILQVNVPEKYRLSAKACEGILRRAEKRGKTLPPMLREALEETILADLG